MPETPDGILSQPLAALRALVAASPSWQAWVGASSADEAAQRVHLLVAPVTAPRPYALIDFGDVARERIAVTNRIKWQDRIGSTMLLWIQSDAGNGVEPDATIGFCNRLGAVMTDIETNAGDRVAGFPGLLLIDLVNPPLRVEEQDRQTMGDYFEAGLSLTYARAA